MKKALLAVAGASAVAAGLVAWGVTGKSRPDMRLPHRYSNNSAGELSPRSWRTRKFYQLVDAISWSAALMAENFGQGEHFMVLAAWQDGYHPTWVAAALADIESSEWVFYEFVKAALMVDDIKVPVDGYIFRRVNM